MVHRKNDTRRDLAQAFILVIARVVVLPFKDGAPIMAACQSGIFIYSHAITLFGNENPDQYSIHKGIEYNFD